jgi:hypothetical protein
MKGHYIRIKPVWNKGLTKETNEIVKRLAEDKKGKYRTLEQKQCMSEKMLEYWKNPTHDENSRNEKIRNTERLQYLNGRTPSCPHIYSALNHVFRSLWELVLAQWLSNNNIIWEYEKKRFKLKNGKTYIPDFYLPEFDTYIEVKGRFYSEHALSKPMFLKEENPDIKLFILDYEGYKKICKKLGISYRVRRYSKMLYDWQKPIRRYEIKKKS